MEPPKKPPEKEFEFRPRPKLVKGNRYINTSLEEIIEELKKPPASEEAKEELKEEKEKYND